MSNALSLNTYTLNGHHLADLSIHKKDGYVLVMAETDNGESVRITGFKKDGVRTWKNTRNGRFAYSSDEMIDMAVYILDEDVALRDELINRSGYSEEVKNRLSLYRTGDEPEGV
jgi:hypothetical protein